MDIKEWTSSQIKPLKGITVAKIKINLTLERDLWDSLSKFAYEQSLAQEKRLPTIELLRTAIEVFLRLEIKEINEILDREPRKIGFNP
jgi:hypothetical protein